MASKQNGKLRRSYNEQNMERAIMLVTKRNWSKRKAAKCCGVPESSLRDQFNKGSAPRYQGPLGCPSFIPPEQEMLLKNHIIKLAQLGFPLSRSEVLKLATSTAVFLGLKKPDDKPLSKHWIQRFLKRWPELKVVKPQKLNLRRATATTEEVVTYYYKELEIILNKYDLIDKPHLIFNIDETGFQLEHEPHKVVAPKGCKTNSITTERGAITTVLAAGNAIGQSIPPYFIFKGKRLPEELKSGSLPGSGFQMTKTGWSNGEVFQTYIEDHITKYLPARSDQEYVLFLYDGHSSHISIPLIEFALSKKIILFVLPPHTSHLLQPLDVSVFGPLKKYYSYECQRRMRENPGERITRYHVCELVSKAYAKALSIQNLTSAFRKTGIVPLDKQQINPLNFLPAENLKKKATATTPRPSDQSQSQASLETCLTTRIPTPKDHSGTKAKRKYSYRPGGVAITDEKIVLKIRKVLRDKDEKQIKEKPQMKAAVNPPSIDFSQQTIADENSEENSVCCICGQFSPPLLREFLQRQIKFVDWAKCDNCNHWVHLEFCIPDTKETVSEKQPFLCPHCQDEE